MRRTMKNFAKVIKKKEDAAWHNVKNVEKKYGEKSIELQKALAEWSALFDVKMMIDSPDFFDICYDLWVDD